MKNEIKRIKLYKHENIAYSILYECNKPKIDKNREKIDLKGDRNIYRIYFKDEYGEKDYFLATKEEYNFLKLNVDIKDDLECSFKYEFWLELNDLDIYIRKIPNKLIKKGIDYISSNNPYYSTNFFTTWWFYEHLYINPNWRIQDEGIYKLMIEDKEDDR